MIRAPIVASSPRASLAQTFLVGTAITGLLVVLLVRDEEQNALLAFQRGATSIVEQARRESEIAVELVEEVAGYAAASSRLSQADIDRYVAVADEQYPHFVYGLLGAGRGGPTADLLTWTQPATPFLTAMVEELRAVCAAAGPFATANRMMRTDAEDRRYAGLFVRIARPEDGCVILIIPSGVGAERVVARAEHAGFLAYLFLTDDPQERPWRCLVGGHGAVPCPAATDRQQIEANHPDDWRMSGRVAHVPGAPQLLVVPQATISMLEFVTPTTWLLLAIGILATLGVAVLRYRGALDRAAVARSDRRYRALIDDSPICIVGWDGDGTIVNWNPAAERLLGWTRVEAVGAQVADRLRAVASDPPLVLEPAARGSELAFQERQLLRADGSSVLVEVLLRAIEFEDGRQHSALVRDVTALRAADSERQHLERLVGAATLASGFAHDFNNLLTVIGGNLEFIDGQLERGSPVREDLVVAQNATAKASALVRNMLQGSRRRGATVEETPLDEAIERSRGAMKQVLGARIELDLALGAGAARVEVDTSWFESVLLNVLINSRHAMAKGGTVRVSTWVEQRRAVVEIADGGTGMTAEVLARAFEPFFTTKPEGVGNGLGLSMVRSFARTYGGDAEIESTPGVGTTVRIRLALAAPLDGVSPTRTTLP